jgi:hypothetical protein
LIKLEGTHAHQSSYFIHGAEGGEFSAPFATGKALL